MMISDESEMFNVINLCILIAKYYTHFQKLVKNDRIDLYD